jgi:hypothetical protein
VEQLQRDLGEEQGMWLAKMARGQDGESVAARLLPKSIGCGKSFRAHLLITSVETVCPILALSFPACDVSFSANVMYCFYALEHVKACVVCHRICTKHACDWC